jgi:hypothetical protein
LADMVAAMWRHYRARPEAGQHVVPLQALIS